MARLAGNERDGNWIRPRSLSIWSMALRGREGHDLSVWRRMGTRLYVLLQRWLKWTGDLWKQGPAIMAVTRSTDMGHGCRCSSEHIVLSNRNRN